MASRAYVASGARTRPWYVWPFVLLWRLVTFIANLTGIILALVFGLVLMAVSLLFIHSILGAAIGIPLFLLGLFLLVRAIL